MFNLPRLRRLLRTLHTRNSGSDISLTNFATRAKPTLPVRQSAVKPKVTFGTLSAGILTSLQALAPLGGENSRLCFRLILNFRGTQSASRCVGRGLALSQFHLACSTHRQSLLDSPNLDRRQFKTETCTAASSPISSPAVGSRKSPRVLVPSPGRR